MARDTWTDERLDDLNHRVDSGFIEVGREFQALRLEVRTEFAAVRTEMKTEFAAVRSELVEMRGEMAAMNRQLFQVGIGAIVTLAVGFAGTIATIATQV
ncbi:MAG TPA: hypothetical protein VFR04_06585 [Solirubrobacterales bacterium]|nr:hypothetical protein [Solirubrobacterales bacterium]